MNVKVIAGYAAIALIVWFMIENPHSAAHFIQNIGDFISTAASGLSHFVSTI